MGRKKKTAEDYKEIAKDKEFKWLGPLPQNTSIKTWWMCPTGHKWEALYHSINKGHGCPYCVGIAIEYDSWFWHGGKLENDKRRDRKLIEAGWRILHIKSNNKLPTQDQLNIAIAQLQSGKVRTEIVLDDWGRGPIFTGFT